MNSNTLKFPSISGDQRRWLALVVVCFGQFMIVLDSTIVNVALASIQGDLHFTQAELTWVVNAYLITFGSLLLLAGRAGDLIGRKKVFLGGVVLFTAASVMCGIAQDPATLIAARFLQGAGGALSSGVILALIVTGFPKPIERAQAMSVFTFVIAGGGSIGLLAGGLLTEWVSWHWIFFINLPVGVATFWLGAVLIDETEGIGLRQGVDIAGSLLVSGFSRQLPSQVLINTAVEKQNYYLARGRAVDTGISADEFATAPKVPNGLNAMDLNSYQTAVHPALSAAQFAAQFTPPANANGQKAPGFIGGPGGSGIVVISGSNAP